MFLLYVSLFFLHHGYVFMFLYWWNSHGWLNIDYFCVLVKGKNDQNIMYYYLIFIFVELKESFVVRLKIYLCNIWVLNPNTKNLPVDTLSHTKPIEFCLQILPPTIFIFRCPKKSNHHLSFKIFFYSMNSNIILVAKHYALIWLLYLCAIVWWNLFL